MLSLHEVPQQALNRTEAPRIFTATRGGIRMYHRMSLIAALMLVLTGCSSEQSPPNADSEQPKEHVLSNHQRALEKAREVEKMVEEQYQRQRKIIDQQ